MYKKLKLGIYLCLENKYKPVELNISYPATRVQIVAKSRKDFWQQVKAHEETHKCSFQQYLPSSEIQPVNG